MEEKIDIAELDKFFKFKVGGIVSLVGVVVVPAKERKKGIHYWGQESEQQRMMIVERHIQQCPGGIQKHYTARAIFKTGSHTLEYVRYNEIELQESKPFEIGSTEEVAEYDEVQINKWELSNFKQALAALRAHDEKGEGK